MNELEQAPLKIDETLDYKSYQLLGPDFDKAKDLSREDLRKFIGQIEELMKNGEQLDVPIKHYFSKGVYGREMILPAGALIVGKIHKFQNLNILSKGEASVLSIDGVMRVKAPFTLVSQPGAKRVIYAHDEVVWTTILGSDEKDPNKIEETFIAKNYDEIVEIENKEVIWLSSQGQ